MSGLKKIDSFNWLLMEWKNGSRNVVHVKSVVSPLDEKLRPGDVIKLNWRGEPKTATFIAHARHRDTLDAVVKESVKAETGPNCKSETSSSRTYKEEEGEAEDFSCSESSWAPSHDEENMSLSDSDTVTKKIRKLERPPLQGDTPVKPKMRKRTCKTPTAIRNYSKRRHTSLTKIMSIENILPDSKKWQNGEELQNEEEVLGNMHEVEDAFTNIFNLIDNLKRQCAINQNSKEHVEISLKAELSETPNNEQSVHEDEEDDSDELNRSEDNVLITNKYNIAERNERVEDEWIPIGSGKTLIHKDNFKRVNWKSFTLATRTLLLALFPRRTLATHSLTGKKSPAFKEKLAKMILDPKIISDVIIEITERFNVKENVVRKIITNKCADECKMYKTRTNKRKSENDENVPPATKNNLDEEHENQYKHMRYH